LSSWGTDVISQMCLYHENKFSEEEFEELVLKTAVKVAKNHIKRNREIKGSYSTNPCFYYLKEEVCDILCKEYGFCKFDGMITFTILNDNLLTGKQSYYNSSFNKLNEMLENDDLS
jgi:hypothetical protein